MPRKVRDLLLAVVGAALVVGALALIDRRVPGQVAGMARDVSAGGWHARGSLLDTVLGDVLTSAPMAEDMFLMAIVAAGVVLVILMVRT